MVFAFARDGGLPASELLAKVEPTQGAPVAAIWSAAVAAIAITLYAEAFTVLATACAVFLYVSYVLPIGAGLFAEGKKWQRKGPFTLGVWSRPIAVLAILGGVTLIWVGIQPPNDKVLTLLLGLGAFLLVYWWVLGERGRFRGPPKGLDH